MSRPVRRQPKSLMIAQLVAAFCLLCPNPSRGQSTSSSPAASEKPSPSPLAIPGIGNSRKRRPAEV